uniref:Uncharacterized protein n=1 Tax=uncultured marine virus TaxID=186617 RepID=A0A0F7L3J5_9VIRU|nr:hypothetical protein [uncultured marine virus]
MIASFIKIINSFLSSSKTTSWLRIRPTYSASSLSFKLPFSILSSNCARFTPSTIIRSQSVA